MKHLTNVKIVLSDKVLENSSITFDKKIIAIGGEKPENAELIEGKGCTVLPGFIDVHTHGNGGDDTMDGGNTVAKIAERMVHFGVTSFLATTVAASRENVKIALENVRDAIGTPNAATVLGAHVEGPFLCEKYKGAHDAEFLVNPDFTYFNGFENIVRLVTIAPELDGAEDFIKECSKNNIRCSIGHTAATFEQCKKALEWGAVSFTHCYNAMSPLTHREPGTVGAAMLTEGFTELICDNIHVSPPAQKVLSRMKHEKMMLITDSLRVADWDVAEFTLGTLKGKVVDGAARLHDGTLAGSVLSMNLAARNYMNNTNLSLPEVVKCTSYHQAQMLGIDNAKGSLTVGFDADLAILSDNFDVCMTVVGGEIVYNG